MTKRGDVSMSNRGLVGKKSGLKFKGSKKDKPKKLKKQKNRRSKSKTNNDNV